MFLVRNFKLFGRSRFFPIKEKKKKRILLQKKEETHFAHQKASVSFAPGRAHRKSAGGGTERSGGSESAPVPHQARLALWLAATVVTAAGRIEGDRHWLSDTVGGAALGVIFVSGSLAVLRLLDEKCEE